MNLPAGKLNRRVRFEKRNGTVDALNEPLDVWVTHREAWCWPLNPTGSRAATNEEGLPGGPVFCSIRIRYSQDITKDMRAWLGDEVFEVIDVLPDYAGKSYTDVVCKRGTSDG